MRVVSQDGTIDVPYDICAFSIGQSMGSYPIYARSKLLDEKPCIFAVYSTEEKAIKAMEMLREEYQRYSKVFQFPKDEENRGVIDGL